MRCLEEAPSLLEQQLTSPPIPSGGRGAYGRLGDSCIRLFFKDLIVSGSGVSWVHWNWVMQNCRYAGAQNFSFQGSELWRDEYSEVHYKNPGGIFCDEIWKSEYSVVNYGMW